MGFFPHLRSNIVSGLHQRERCASYRMSVLALISVALIGLSVLGEMTVVHVQGLPAINVAGNNDDLGRDGRAEYAYTQGSGLLPMTWMDGVDDLNALQEADLRGQQSSYIRFGKRSDEEEDPTALMHSDSFNVSHFFLSTNLL